ncbi:MAG: dicarboxylate/amino acid:cation symporter [Armatimonadota bacterium]
MRLHYQIGIGFVLGLVIGCVIRVTGLGEASVAYRVCDTVGELFLRLIRMVVVPLIFASVVYSVARLGDLRRLSRIGGRTLAFYLTTTTISVVIGMVVVTVVRPGVGAELGLTAGAERLARITQEGPPSVSELLLRIVPTNPIDALVKADVLQIIFFGIIFGAGLGALGPRAERVTKVVEDIYHAMLLIVHWVLKVIPIGVCALMARAVARAGLEMMVPLAKYMGAVIAGLGVHGLIVLPLIVWLVGRIRPWRFYRGISEAAMTAFSTASSSATLPVTMDNVATELGVSRRIGNFVLPLGATINMDGTALYEAVAAMFIAQAYGIELTMTQQLLVVLTATMAAIGAAGIPEAGLFTMVIVLNAVGLPTEGIGLILAVDRILDMCRTTVNVTGDAVGAVVVGRLEGEVEEPGSESAAG